MPPEDLSRSRSTTIEKKLAERLEEKARALEQQKRASVLVEGETRLLERACCSCLTSVRQESLAAMVLWRNSLARAR